ncbi:MAG TPA: AMMECR1 domain-containing protein [Lentisphaeria bacterium]|nr:AMMECR1 domain-containing protein [Lentisphaeria bacterium]
MKICRILLTLFCFFLAQEASAWWWWRKSSPAGESVQASEPAVTPAEELRQQAAAWLGAMATENPSRRVRAVHVPGGNLSASGASWGVGFGRLAADVRTAYLLFAPAPGGNPAERRIVVATAEQYTTLLGTAGGAKEVCAALLQSGDGLFVKGTLNEAAEQRIDDIAALLLYKLHTVEVVPLFLNAATPVAETVAALAPLLADPQSVLIAFWPDDGSATTQDWKAILTSLAADTAADSPLPAQVAFELAKSLQWGTIDVRVAGQTPAPGGALLHLEPAVNLELIAKAASLDWDDAETKAAFLDATRAVTNENYRGEAVNSAEKALLLDLARRVITTQLEKQEPPPLPTYSRNLMQKYGCQVAINKGDVTLGQYLIMPGKEPLVKAVVMNSANFLKADGERPPITMADLTDAKFEISVISEPEAVTFKTLEELYSRLQPGRHGVLLTAGGKPAGFLPVVWKQVPEPAKFMEALCRRIGQTTEALTKPDTKVEVFEVFTFAEE